MNEPRIRGRILVTPRSVTRKGHPVLQRLKDEGYQVLFCTPGQQPNADELRRLLPGCAGYLAGVEEIDGSVLSAATELKVISRNGVGVDRIDLAAAAECGVVVRTAVGANARGVAELTIAHLFALARWIPFGDQAIKAGRWERRKGVELRGRTLSLLGCGNIGRMVAKLALGLEMRVIAYDVKPDPSFAPSADFEYVSFDDALVAADALSLHCPPSPDGKPLIGARELERIKPGVLLINTARADLVDRTALQAALEQGKVAGASLDVFEKEPPTSDPLPKHNRVIASPHVGGFTDESVDNAMQSAVNNLLEELRKSH